MSPGKKMKPIKRPKVYEGLRAEGMSKQRAAKIANTPAKKAARNAAKSRRGSKR